ncbi:MAG: pilin [Patescibacteria group bacterium]|nr:pilin [Patescibacteria group bacterium]
MRQLAQSLCVGDPNNPTITPQCLSGPLDSSINTLGDLINRLMQFIIPLAGIILFLVIIWGGYDFLMSGGNQDKIKSGKSKITAGLVGFILLSLAYFITKIIAKIFGLEGGGIL